MASWTFLTTHARVLLRVAHDPGVRLRDIAASLDITERSLDGGRATAETGAGPAAREPWDGGPPAGQPTQRSTGPEEAGT